MMESLNSGIALPLFHLAKLHISGKWQGLQGLFNRIIGYCHAVQIKPAIKQLCKLLITHSRRPKGYNLQLIISSIQLRHR